MNCDLWRSQGRVLAHCTCLFFSLCLWVVM